MSHAHTATTDSRLSPHRAYTFQCVTCIQCHLSRAYDTTQLPVAWYRWTGQHIHTCHVFMDSPLSIHTIIFLSYVYIVTRRAVQVNRQPFWDMSRAHTATPQTHVYIHTGEILSDCRMYILSPVTFTYVTCSYCHTTDSRLVHTGDILERVICIYCHLSHAYDTTILPVALDM